MAASRVGLSSAAGRQREPWRNRARRVSDYLRRYRRLQINIRQQHAVLPTSRARAADPANRDS
jgi:hypothetical protein